MIVAELIERLQQMPRDAVVVIPNENQGWDYVQTVLAKVLMTTDKADYIESIGDLVERGTRITVYTKTDDHKNCIAVILGATS